jgi:hypothetical protein
MKSSFICLLVIAADELTFRENWNGVDNIQYELAFHLLSEILIKTENGALVVVFRRVHVKVPAANANQEPIEHELFCMDVVDVLIGMEPFVDKWPQDLPHIPAYVAAGLVNQRNHDIRPQRIADKPRIVHPVPEKDRRFTGPAVGAVCNVGRGESRVSDLLAEQPCERVIRAW